MTCQILLKPASCCAKFLRVPVFIFKKNVVVFSSNRQCFFLANKIYFIMPIGKISAAALPGELLQVGAEYVPIVPGHVVVPEVVRHHQDNVGGGRAGRDLVGFCQLVSILSHGITLPSCFQFVHSTRFRHCWTVSCTSALYRRQGDEQDSEGAEEIEHDCLLPLSTL